MFSAPVYGSRVALGDGQGGFELRPDRGNGATTSITVDDFNGDGNADVAGAGNVGVTILLGDGNGSFAESFIPVGSNLIWVISADLNHDCNADLVALSDQSDIWILLGDGTGKFSAPSTIGSVLNPRSSNNVLSMAAGDLDGDGNVDLVFPDNSQFSPITGPKGRAVVYLGNGAGGFGAPSTYAVNQLVDRVALADFNGDGKLDIAFTDRSSSVTTSSGTLSVLLNEGGGIFSAPKTFSITTGTNFLVAGDFNGDGSSDLVTSAVSYFNGRSAPPSSVAVIFNSCPAAATAGQGPSVQFSSPCFGTLESGRFVQVGVTRAGNLSGETTVDYFTSDGTASDVSDYTAAFGRLRFAPNEAGKTLRIVVTDDAYVEPPEVFRISLADPTGGVLGTPASATITIRDTDTSPGPNPIGAADADFFVRQHYADFLNRVPDAQGLEFWKNEIISCGSDAGCVEAKRINVSAAFFLSIEFQETGYLAYRTYKAAYGDATSPNVAGTVPVIRLREFLADALRIGQDVQVNVGDWERQLEANKRAYMLEFVQRPRFATAFPASMTPAQFVGKLDGNAGGVLSQTERDELVAGLAAAPDPTQGRAEALRKVAEDADLRRNEKNRAFVLMQYFGYLRRDPDASPDADFRGWRFWLSKLEEFNGDFIRAELVKAFLSSDEYRQRFGQ